VGIEEIERGRVFYVRRVDEDQAIREAVRGVWRKQVQPDQLVDHVPLAVDDHHRSAVRPGRREVVENHPLHQLGLAVAGAADDVAVFKAALDRGLERRRQIQKVQKRRVAEVHLGQFGRGLALLPRRHDELVGDRMGIGFRRIARRDQQVRDQLQPQTVEQVQRHRLVVVRQQHQPFDRLRRPIKQLHQRHPERVAPVRLPVPKPDFGQAFEHRLECVDHAPLEHAEQPVEIARPATAAGKQFSHIDGGRHVAIDQPPVRFDLADVFRLEQPLDGPVGAVKDGKGDQARALFYESLGHLKREIVEVRARQWGGAPEAIRLGPLAAQIIQLARPRAAREPTADVAPLHRR
jgi:hypothetical protein